MKWFKIYVSINEEFISVKSWPNILYNCTWKMRKMFLTKLFIMLNKWILTYMLIYLILYVFIPFPIYQLFFLITGQCWSFSLKLGWWKSDDNWPYCVELFLICMLGLLSCDLKIVNSIPRNSPSASAGNW